jgi:hypothetical protein
VSAVDQQIEEAHQVLEHVVSVESATLIDGVRRVGAMFEEKFNALAFSTRWVEMPEEMERVGVLLFALSALQEAGALDERNMVVALMGDDERSGQPRTLRSSGARLFA